MTSSADSEQRAASPAYGGDPADSPGREAPTDRPASRRLKMELSHFLFGMLFIAIGVLLAWPFFNSDIVRENLIYREAEAKITESMVVESTIQKTAEPGSTLKPFVSVLFKVNERTFSAEPFSTTYPGSDDEARALIARHPTGGTMAIYYDPGNPQEVIAERSWFPRVWFWIPVLIGTAFMMFLGVMVIVEELKKIGRTVDNDAADPFLQRWREIKQAEE